MRDGNSSKSYAQHKASRNARKMFKEKGYLQVDEMKLKHGIFWNSKTGEAIGLVNDILGMDTVMRRILSDEW